MHLQDDVTPTYMSMLPENWTLQYHYWCLIKPVTYCNMVIVGKIVVNIHIATDFYFNNLT